jgi:cytidyltransferase-like protein
MNIGEEIVSQLLEESTPIIALYPGKFKPPHAGHFDVVVKAAEIADKVIVIMSQVSKDEFTAEDSMKVWRLYEDLLPNNVQILISGKASPVSEVFDIIKDKKTDFIVLYGKGEESRYKAIENDPNTYSNVKIVDAGTFENLNASDLRPAIRNKDLKKIQTFLPDGIDAKKVLDVYTQKEFKPGPILHESFTPQKAPLMKKFVEYACNRLNITEPKIVLITSPDYAPTNHSFGLYGNDSQRIKVVVHNRNTADVLRTLAHELVHHQQNLQGRMYDGAGEDGSPIENEAHAVAGVIMREFGRENPEIFE